MGGGGPRQQTGRRHTGDCVCFQQHKIFTRNDHVRSAVTRQLQGLMCLYAVLLRLFPDSVTDLGRADFRTGPLFIFGLIIKKIKTSIRYNLNQRQGFRIFIAKDADGNLPPLNKLLHHNFPIVLKCLAKSSGQLFRLPDNGHTQRRPLPDRFNNQRQP